MKDSELLVKFLKLIPSGREVEKRVGYSSSKNNYNLLTPAEKYVMNIFNLYNRLTGLLADLDRVITFTKRYPASNYYEKNNIDKLDYLKYHTEVYLHKIHTIMEVKKLILDEVYELGIPEKDCSWTKIKRNQIVNQTRAFKLIELFYKSFDTVIEARHRNTHRALYESCLDLEVESTLEIYKLSEELDMEIDEDFYKYNPNFLLDYQLKLHRKERVTFMQNGKNVVHEYTDMFMNEILKVAIQKHSEKEK